MTKKLLSFFAFSILAAISGAHAGGPWLVYNFVQGNEGSLLLLNLGYDSGPQFAFTEQDPDEEVWLKYNTKSKLIWKRIYDGDDTSGARTQNQWHRLSWGRQENTFALAYSQYEVMGPSGVADHGVFFGTGTCVAWPNGSKDIGINGKYPATIQISLLRIDGGWQGSALGTGSRNLEVSKVKASLNVSLTKAINAARGSLGTNIAAKEWVINYFINQLNYSRGTDVYDE